MAVETLFPLSRSPKTAKGGEEDVLQPPPPKHCAYVYNENHALSLTCRQQRDLEL